MFRTMLESLCMDDSKKSVKLELDSKYYDDMQSMYRSSFYFDYLLNFNGSARGNYPPPFFARRLLSPS